MAFVVKDTLDVIVSELMKTNIFSTVAVGEPKAPPTDAKMTAHVWMNSINEVAGTLDKTIEVYLMTVRVMIPMLEEPVGTIESDLAEAVSKADEALFANFSLDNKIRNIDILGQYGANYRVDWGYVEISQKIFRAADITLPMIVDDSAAMVA